MNKVRTLLLDDEFLALRLLEDFSSRIGLIEIVGQSRSAVQAAEIIHQNNVDLMFLDIQMPGIQGTKFLRSLENPPVAIFTTAYSDHAIEAFELGAIDYLLKPFSFERFFQATQKAIDAVRHKRNELAPSELLSDRGSFLTVKADGKIYKIPLDEILYVEGLKEYLRIVTPSKTYITLETFKNLEIALPRPQFIRVHKSYMVAKNKVRSSEGNTLEINSVQIPISREKKDEVLKLIFDR